VEAALLPVPQKAKLEWELFQLPRVSKSTPSQASDRRWPVGPFATTYFKQEAGVLSGLRYGLVGSLSYTDTRSIS